MMRGRNLPYDVKTLVRSLLILVGTMLSMFLTKGTGFLLVIPFIFVATMRRDKPEQLFYWLLLTISMIVGNAYLMPKSLIFSVAQRGTLLILAFIMVVQIAGMKSCIGVKPILCFTVYIFYMIIPSCVGWSPIISFLKMILFFSVFYAFYGAVSRIATSRKSDARVIRSVALSFTMFFMVGSLLLLPFPGISQMVPSEFAKGTYNPEATSLFKGMTMHSQCMGPCAAMCGVFVIADLVFNIRRWDKLYVFLAFLCPFLIFKTSSRTAMGAYIAGICFLMFFFFHAKGIKNSWRSKVVSIALVAMAGLAMAVVMVPSLQKSAVKFVLKGKDAEVSFDSITSSREALNERSMYNFRKKPAIGNGFQVGEAMAEDNHSEKSLKDFLSAPIEKGFWGSAVLEEGGVVGFSIFVISILFLLGGLIKHKSYIGATMFFVLFVCNFGEFMMFSMSYTGGFLWAMVFCGLAIDSVRSNTIVRRVDYYGW